MSLFNIEKFTFFQGRRTLNKNMIKNETDI